MEEHELRNTMKNTMKRRYEIQAFCEFRQEWRKFDNRYTCCKNRGIDWIRNYREDPYYKTTKYRLVEVTERVIPVGKDKAWPIQQLLP